jgi:hypothetical protein
MHWQEFVFKCQASQKFLHMQIPWATAGAERAREERLRQLSTRSNAAQQEPTIEEQLLSELLLANGDLLDVLRLHDDLEHIRVERETEERSRWETRMNPPVR